MYDKKGFFIENPIKRYSIGDRNKLKFNTDGSLDIFIQTAAPEGTSSNWLPSPNDTFALTLRLYLPQDSFLDGSWTLPAVERID